MWLYFTWEVVWGLGEALPFIIGTLASVFVITGNGLLVFILDIVTQLLIRFVSSIDGLMGEKAVLEVWTGCARVAIWVGLVIMLTWNINQKNVNSKFWFSKTFYNVYLSQQNTHILELICNEISKLWKDFASMITIYSFIY